MQFINIDERFKTVGKLGEGTYGIVNRVVEHTTSKEYALKLSQLNDDTIIKRAILKEVSILKKVDHEYIIKIHEIFFGIWNNKKYICILMALCEGSLFDFGQNYKPTKEGAISKFLQILSALNYLGNLGYIHGDLNPNNIMIDSNNIKVIDFGFARKIYRKFDTDLPPTIIVRPMELLHKNGNFNISTIDTWAVGYILYYLLTHNPLIFSSNELEQFNNIIELLGPPKKKMLNLLGIDEKKIKDREQINPSLDILKFEYYKELKILKNMLQYNPSSRPSMEQLVKNKQIQHYSREYGIPIDSMMIITSSEAYLEQSIISEEQRLDILSFVITLVKDNDLSDEIIFYVMYNLQKLLVIEDLLKSMGCSIITLVIILFWSATKIISINTYKLIDIKNILHSLGVDWDDNRIKYIYCTICEYLKWDLDPETVYSYIQHVPDKYRDHFRYINFILLTDKNMEIYSDFTRCIFSYIVIMFNFNLTNSSMYNFIEMAIEKKKLTINQLIKDYEHVNELIQNGIGNGDKIILHNLYAETFDLNSIRNWWEKLDLRKNLERWIEYHYTNKLIKKIDL